MLSGAVAGPRIGIYGGTFDPVHHGHLLLARDAVEHLKLERLIFVPAAISPHKLERIPAAPGRLRLEMVEAAIAGEGSFQVDDCELRRPGPSYTIDTLLAVRQRFPVLEKLFYFIGQDNAAALSAWHRYEELESLAEFVVFPREEIGYPDEASHWRRVDISSTEVRNRLAAGLSIRYLVPESVLRIIEKRRLYLSPPAGAEPSPPRS